jgi:energy-coupling factor transporter ATP-binding protein EcfA2
MTGRLEIDGVSKRYGDVLALQEMTFEVRAGELFGFVGSNGAGKTTTMRIVLGCWPPIGARSGGMAGRSTSKTGGASGTCRVDAPEAPFAALSSVSGTQVQTSTVPDRATGERQIRAGTLDALVVGGAGASPGARRRVWWRRSPAGWWSCCSPRSNRGS